MASWVTEHSDEGIDTPATYTIDSPDAYARVQAIFATDMHAAGATIREVARLLKISKSSTHRLIKAVPVELAERNRDERYLRRLREVLATKPKDFSAVAKGMMAKAGSSASEVDLLRAISRRRSAETAVGLLPRKGDR